MVDWKDLREQLRKRRDSLGLSLDDVAASSGVNRATIHSLENIKREPNLIPEFATIQKLVDALDLDVSVVFLQRTQNQDAEEKNRAVTSPDRRIGDKRTPTPTEVDVHDQWYGPAVSAARVADVNRRIRLLEQAMERLNAERDAAIGARSRSVPSARRKKSVRGRSRT